LKTHAEERPSFDHLTVRTRRAARLSPAEILAMFAVSLLGLVASLLRWWPISMTEAWGFVTGGICVWLVVREHMWNWPIGLANNLFFFVLFLRGRLFADMALQVVYFILGLYGWSSWKFGGELHSALQITRTTGREWAALGILLPLATIALRQVLVAVNDAAPFWDSLTTLLSLGAQYLLCRKRIENWFLWISADVIYVPLYISRTLPLTAALYAVFLAMCVVGLREWNRALRKQLSPQ
jgi:nicotinamide mononucleotide transporter